MRSQYPAYLNLTADDLASRAESLEKRLEECDLCPRRCGADRTAGEIGFCKTSRHALVASVGPHFGEERPLVGRRGSGTVFFAGCNLGCIFCQNSELSHHAAGRPVSSVVLAEIFCEVQTLGCHNLNLVTPTHVAPQIMSALCLAIRAGLSIPIVWNSGGYESGETLAAFDGVVDIYMPDFKLMNDDTAERLLDARDYPEKARAAVTEMHRQVGDLDIDEDGIARKGLLVRHLVLPGGLADTPEVAHFIANLSENTYLNLMDQYRPCHLAHETPGIERILSQRDYTEASDAVIKSGLKVRRR